MKKVTVVALLGVCGFAFASAMCIPWFLDPGATNAGLAQTYPAFVALVGLNNTTDAPIECQILYYADDGTFLDYNGGTEVEAFPTRNFIWSPTYQTFIIDPHATLQFRPVADDLVSGTTPNGQESSTGAAVPNRPRYGAAGTSTRKANGAITIKYEGEPTAVQGRYVQSCQGVESAYLIPPASQQ